MKRLSSQSGKGLGFLLVLSGVVAGLEARGLAAPAKKPSTYERFVNSCVHAFGQSSDPSTDTAAVGREICECTAHESKHQGVSVKQLQQETAKIDKDPKYKISNPNLMNAFRYCTIEMMRKADFNPPESGGGSG